MAIMTDGNVGPEYAGDVYFRESVNIGAGHDQGSFANARFATYMGCGVNQRGEGKTALPQLIKQFDAALKVVVADCHDQIERLAMQGGPEIRRPAQDSVFLREVINEPGDSSARVFSEDLEQSAKRRSADDQQLLQALVSCSTRNNGIDAVLKLIRARYSPKIPRISNCRPPKNVIPAMIDA